MFLLFVCFGPGSNFCATVISVSVPPQCYLSRSRSFCQKCMWQVTAKYACTLRMWLCMKLQGAWLYGVHRTRRDGSSFMWHQPCQRCKYTTWVDIQKCAIKKEAIHSCRITCERSECAPERRIVLYKSDQQLGLRETAINFLVWNSIGTKNNNKKQNNNNNNNKKH